MSTYGGFSWKRNHDNFKTVKSTKQPKYDRSVTTYTVCETCMIDTAHGSIVFPFIFIVKFSDRLQCDFWVGDRDRKYFSTIWTEMIPVVQFIQHFPIFWLGTLFHGHWLLGYSIKKPIWEGEGEGRGWGHKFFISLLYPRKFHKIVLGLSEVRRGQKPRPLPWKFRIVFSWSPLDGNSTSFLVNPWKF